MKVVYRERNASDMMAASSTFLFTGQTSPRSSNDLPFRFNVLNGKGKAVGITLKINASMI